MHGTSLWRQVKKDKILPEGQLYIVRPDGAIYNATGVRVK